jgi:hypothetical protein
VLSAQQTAAPSSQECPGCWQDAPAAAWQTPLRHTDAPPPLGQQSVSCSQAPCAATQQLPATQLRPPQQVVVAEQVVAEQAVGAGTASPVAIRKATDAPTARSMRSRARGRAVAVS